jgi:hypothetical protein
MKADRKSRTLAIESITLGSNDLITDPGIQGLMPYFVQFITDTVFLSNIRLQKTSRV